MARQSNDLLGNVTPLGEDRHFLDKVTTVDLHVQFAQQPTNPIQYSITVGFDNQRRSSSDLVEFEGDVVAQL